MTRMGLIGWVALVLACVAAIAWSVQRERSALRDALDAVSTVERVDAGLKRLESLSVQRPAWVDRAAPEAELAKRLAATLGQNALPASSLANVEPDAPAPVGRLDDQQTGPLIKRARASVTLRPLTLPEVGRFLDAFRQREPDWTITSVRIEPERLAKTPPNSSSMPRDLPLVVALSVESLYVERPDLRRHAAQAGVELPSTTNVARPATAVPSTSTRLVPDHKPTSSTRARPAPSRNGTTSR